MRELLMRNKFSQQHCESSLWLQIAGITLCLMTCLSVSNWTAHLINMSRELTQTYIQKSKLTPTNWFLNNYGLKKILSYIPLRYIWGWNILSVVKLGLRENFWVWFICELYHWIILKEFYVFCFLFFFSGGSQNAVLNGKMLIIQFFKFFK